MFGRIKEEPTIRNKLALLVYGRQAMLRRRYRARAAEPRQPIHRASVAALSR
jgi:hypothetical protein